MAEKETKSKEPKTEATLVEKPDYLRNHITLLENQRVIIRALAVVAKTMAGDMELHQELIQRNTKTTELLKALTETAGER